MSLKLISSPLSLSHSEMHCIFLNVKIIQMCPLYLETLSLMWCVYHRLLLWPELHVSYSGGREAGCSPSSCFTTSISRHEVRCKVETLQHNTTLPSADSRQTQISTHHWLHAPWNNLNIHFYSSPPRNIKESRSQRPGVNHLLKSKWYFSLQYSLILIYW